MTRYKFIKELEEKTGDGMKVTSFIALPGNLTRGELEKELQDWGGESWRVRWDKLTAVEYDEDGEIRRMELTPREEEAEEPEEEKAELKTFKAYGETIIKNNEVFTPKAVCHCESMEVIKEFLKQSGDWIKTGDRLIKVVFVEEIEEGDE